MFLPPIFSAALFNNKSLFSDKRTAIQDRLEHKYPQPKVIWSQGNFTAGTSV